MSVLMRYARPAPSLGVAFPKVRRVKRRAKGTRPLLLSKEQQVGRYSRQILVTNDCPEEELQCFVNNYLDIRRVAYIRVPSTNSITVMRAALAGIPDNTCKIPITDKYSLCLNLELKTRTQLHGKQVRNANEQFWQIAQTHEQAQKIIDMFIEDSERIKKILKKALRPDC